MDYIIEKLLVAQLANYSVNKSLSLEPMLSKLRSLLILLFTLQGDSG
jgi:hypothetical protein